MERNRLIQFKAWCSGKAYPYPNRFSAKDGNRVITLYVGIIPLGSFRFYWKKDYASALRLAKRALLKSKVDAI